MSIWLTITCPKTLIVTLFLQAGLIYVGHARLSLTFSRELVREPQLDQKRYPHLVFCIVGLKVDLKDHCLGVQVHAFAVLRSSTRAHLHMSKKRRFSPA